MTGSIVMRSRQWVTGSMVGPMGHWSDRMNIDPVFIKKKS